MPYPRLINLDKDTKERLTAYLREIIERHKMERGDWIQDLMDWQKAYWAKPSQEVRTFPFRGAANIIIPLTAIAVEAIHAREMTSLFALSPFINCTAKSILPLPESNQPVSDVEVPLEEYLHHELIQNCKAKNVIGDLCLDKNKYGTCVGKSGYEKITRRGLRVGPSGEEENFTVIVKDGATISRVPLPNYTMPFQDQDPQTAKWCGEIHSESPYQIKILTESEFFYKDTYEKLREWVSKPEGAAEAQDQQFRRQTEEQEKRKPVWPERLGWYEKQMGFDIDQDGKDEEIIVHYSYDANLLMAVRYNDYDDLHREYRTAVYFPVEGRWPGIGVCKQSIEFQREITIQHRQRLDNATLANIRMIVIHKLSGYGPGEPVFPGKMWFVDDMDHVKTEQMGDVYQSSFANEQSTLLYGQQRWGINELTLGLPQTGTPGTATSDVARIQEASRRFEFTFDQTRDFVSQLTTDLLVNIAMYGSKSKQYFDVVENGHLVREFLTLPISLIRDGLLVEIGATSKNSNRALDRQNAQQIAQVLQMYYTGGLQIAQSIGDPNMMALISQKALLGISEVAKQILQTFDMRNMDRVLFQKEIEAMFNGGANRSTPISGAGGNPSAPGASQPSGLPSAQEIIGLLSGLGAK